MKIEIAALAAAVLFAGCKCNKGGESSDPKTTATCKSSGTAGNGEITKTKREARDFRDVAVEGSLDVEVKEGPWDVQVETDSNVQPLITTTLSSNGRTLVVAGKGEYCTTKLRVYVTMDRVFGVKVNGSGSVDVSKGGFQNDVSLVLNGSGHIVFRGGAAALTSAVSGSGSIMLDSGAARTTNATVNGSGSVRKGAGFTPGGVAKNVNGSGTVDF